METTNPSQNQYLCARWTFLLAMNGLSTAAERWMWFQVFCNLPWWTATWNVTWEVSLVPRMFRTDLQKFWRVEKWLLNIGCQKSFKCFEFCFKSSKVFLKHQHTHIGERNHYPVQRESFPDFHHFTQVQPSTLRSSSKFGIRSSLRNAISFTSLLWR